MGDPQARLYSLRVMPVSAPMTNDTVVDAVFRSMALSGSFSDSGSALPTWCSTQAIKNGWLSHAMIPKKRRYACVPGLMST